MRNSIISFLAFFLLPCSVFAAPIHHYHITDLGPACDDQTVAVNDKTQIVGTFYTNHPIAKSMPDTTTYHAFLWQHGHRKDLGTLKGYPNSSASGINERGQIVGTLDSTTDGAIIEYSDHAFLWEHSRMRDLGTPQGDSVTEAAAINNHGFIVGTAQASGWLPDLGNATAVEAHQPRGFLLSGKTWKILRLSAAQGVSEPIGLNDLGQIVGKGLVAGDDHDHAVLWDGGKLTDLGGPSEGAVAINTKGQVVFQKLNELFLWHNGTATLLPLRSGDIVDQNLLQRFAINDREQVVGTVLRQSRQETEECATLWQHGSVFDLNTLTLPRTGWTLRRASDISVTGQIVGTGLYHGQSHAFLLTPLYERQIYRHNHT